LNLMVLLPESDVMISTLQFTEFGECYLDAKCRC
jgi:hypothetical protein